MNSHSVKLLSPHQHNVVRLSIAALVLALAALPFRAKGSILADTPTALERSYPGPTSPGNNSSGRSEIIVDNRDRDSGLANGVFTVGGTSAGWYDSRTSTDTTYNGGGIYTFAGSSWTPGLNNWARWTPNLPRGGNWEIAAFIPRIYTGRHDTSRAMYRVSVGSVVSETAIDQKAIAGLNPGWATLGQYNIDAGVAHSVELRDVTDDPFMLIGRYVIQKTVVFDAMRWRNLDSPPSVELQVRPARGPGAVYRVGEGLSLCYRSNSEASLLLSACPNGRDCRTLGDVASAPDNTEVCSSDFSVSTPTGSTTLRLEAIIDGARVATAETNIVIADATGGVPATVILEIRGGCGQTIAPGSSVDVFWGTSRAGLVEVVSLPDGQVLASGELLDGETRVFSIKASSDPGTHVLLARHVQSAAQGQCSYVASGGQAPCTVSAKPNSASETLHAAPGGPVVFPVSVLNTGSCSWSPTGGYALIRMSPDTLGFPEVVPLVRDIPPGSTFETTVTGTAPGKPGTHQVTYALMYGGKPVGSPLGTTLTVGATIEAKDPDITFSMDGHCGGEYTVGDMVVVDVRVRNAPLGTIAIRLAGDQSTAMAQTQDVEGNEDISLDYTVADVVGPQTLEAQLITRPTFAGKWKLLDTDTCEFQVTDDDSTSGATVAPPPTVGPGGASAIPPTIDPIANGGPIGIPNATAKNGSAPCQAPKVSSDAGNKVLLIGGWRSNADDQEGSWRTVRDALTSESLIDLDIDAEDFLYFSYSDRYTCVNGREDFRIPNYQWSDAVPGRESDFDSYAHTVTRILDAFPKATFSLVGHSQGGAIATFWAGSIGSEYKKRVNLVATIGSPLQGVLDCRLPELLSARVYSSEVVRTMKTGVATIRTLTLSGKCDEIVSPLLATDSAAWLGLELDDSSSCSNSRCPVSVAHSALKSSEDAAGYISTAIKPWVATEPEYYVGTKRDPGNFQAYVTFPREKRNVDAIIAGNAKYELVRGAGGEFGGDVVVKPFSGLALLQLQVWPAALVSDRTTLTLRITNGSDSSTVESLPLSVVASDRVNSLLQTSGQISENEEIEAGTFTVGENQRDLHLVLDWPGSALDLELTDPHGQRVVPVYSGMKVTRFLPPTYFTLPDAAPGVWKVRVRGISIPEGTTSFDLRVSAPEGTSSHARTRAILVALLAVIGVGALIYRRKWRPPSSSDAVHIGG